MKMKLFWVKNPMRDKGFVLEDSGGNALAFEEQINQWLAENPNVDIQHIGQSSFSGSQASGYSTLFLSVWYTNARG